MEPIIKVKGVRKRFKSRVVLESIDLDIQKGEIFGIIGMSGSGKSTFLNTLIGFYEPEEGDVHYYSDSRKKFLSLYKDSREVRKNFGFATQAASFYPKLTVSENLDHFGTLYSLRKSERKKSADHLLSMTGLDNAKDILAQNLSGGMEKRLSISCSLVHKPGVLLLDEPTADLDPISRKAMWTLIKQINGQGTTIVIASHLLEELERVCDRLAILHKGKLIDVGTPNELKSKYFKHDEILIETEKQSYTKIGKSLHRSAKYPIETISIRDNKLLVRTGHAEKVMKQLLPIVERIDGKVISADIRKPSLTEVFESLEQN